MSNFYPNDISKSLHMPVKHVCDPGHGDSTWVDICVRTLAFVSSGVRIVPCNNKPGPAL